MLKKILLIVVCFSLLTNLVIAQQNEIDTYLKRIVPFGFSGVILIARNDRIILQNGYGLANRQRKIPVNTETVFYIGSITKQFTAAAIVKLEMEGKLQTTDTLDKYFKDVPPDKAKITIHQLLTHSSGLGGADDIYGNPVQKDEQIKRLWSMKLRVEPGREYFYSNPGYNLLGIIVENVAGLPYEQYLHKNLFEPAAMFKTGYRIPKWEPNHVAHGYSNGTDKGSPLERPWLKDGPSWAIRGAGGMLSTVGDLYRWHLALKNDKILSAEAKNKLFSPHIKMFDDSFYGYGWTIQKTARGTALIEHNGGDGIFFADFRRYIDEDTVVIGLTNDVASLNVIEQKIPDFILANTAIPQPPAGIKEISNINLNTYAGQYLLPSGATLTVSTKGNRLLIDPIGQEAVNLLTQADAAQAEVFQKRNERIKIIIEGILKGDYTATSTAGLNQKSAERYRNYLDEDLGLSSAEERNQTEFQVIGTLPIWFRNGKPVNTIVRIKSKDKTRLVFFRWDNDKIAGFSILPEDSDVSLKTLFVPSSKTDFAGFNIGIEKAINLRFKTMAKGQPVSLEVKTVNGSSLAKFNNNSSSK